MCLLSASLLSPSHCIHLPPLLPASITAEHTTVCSIPEDHLQLLPLRYPSHPGDVQVLLHFHPIFSPPALPLIHACLMSHFNYCNLLLTEVPSTTLSIQNEPLRSPSLSRVPSTSPSLCLAPDRIVQLGCILVGGGLYG